MSSDVTQWPANFGKAPTVLRLDRGSVLRCEPEVQCSSEHALGMYSLWLLSRRAAILR